MKTHFMLSNFFPENRTICGIMSKNVVETEGPQMTSQYGAYVLRAGLARLYAHMHMSTCPGTHMHTRMRSMHAQTSM